MSTTGLVRLLERVGGQGEGFLAYLGGLGYLTLDALKHTALGLVIRPRIKIDETLFQMVRLGVRAVPIIALVQIFVGMILALQLAPVLADYGQLDKVATVVSIAVFRELGPLISAVVLTGFAGAAIAAELGTMVVGEEIAALRTSAIHPVRFLVVPRIIACLLTTVALTVLADIVGAVGGGLIDRWVLQGDSWQYYHTTIESLALKDFLTGLIKSAVFAFIIVLVSCYEGLSVTGGAEGVGRATTRSVVLAIFLIIAADCAFTTFFYFFW
ncbi:MAG: ABC transporter permease [Planctomycetota bacterium]|nr:ABC transporter permease [Planctomycetota bacterium]